MGLGPQGNKKNWCFFMILKLLISVFKTLKKRLFIFELTVIFPLIIFGVFFASAQAQNSVQNGKSIAPVVSSESENNLISTTPVVLDAPKSMREPAKLMDVLGYLFTGFKESSDVHFQPILPNTIGQKITNGKSRETVSKGKVTGRDIPRFVSLRERANLRSGPGKRYPILWTLVTPDQPLEVVAEYQNWRQVIDVSGVRGWVWVRLLKSERRLSVIADEAPLYHDKEHTAKIVARLGKSIFLNLDVCDSVWCKVTTIHPKNTQTGWIRRAHVWGLYENEIFE